MNIQIIYIYIYIYIVQYNTDTIQYNVIRTYNYYNINEIRMEEGNKKRIKWLG